MYHEVRVALYCACVVRVVVDAVAVEVQRGVAQERSAVELPGLAELAVVWCWFAVDTTRLRWHVALDDGLALGDR